MLLGTKQQLAELLVQALSSEHSLSAKQLQALLSKDHREFSIQAIYQELRNLEGNGIVIKVKDTYSLKTAWVLEMATLVDSMYATYLDPAAITGIIPEEGKKKSWVFSDIHRMDNFLTSISIPLAEEGEDKSCYLWAPQAFWHLAHHESEKQFLKGLELAGVNYYVIFGSDAYLNQLYVPYLQGDNYFYSFAESPFHNKIDHYLIVEGDYIVTGKLDKNTKERLDALFQSVQSHQDINVGEILDMFNLPGRMVVTIEHKPQKARKLRRKFRDFFGV